MVIQDTTGLLIIWDVYRQSWHFANVTKSLTESTTCFHRHVCHQVSPSSNIQTKEKSEKRAAELTEHGDVDTGRLHHLGHAGDKVGELAVEAVVVDLLCHCHAQLTRDREQAVGLGEDCGSDDHFWRARERRSMFQGKTVNREGRTWE